MFGFGERRKPVEDPREIEERQKMLNAIKQRETEQQRAQRAAVLREREATEEFDRRHAAEVLQEIRRGPSAELRAEEFFEEQRIRAEKQAELARHERAQEQLRQEGERELRELADEREMRKAKADAIIYRQQAEYDKEENRRREEVILKIREKERLEAAKSDEQRRLEEIKREAEERYNSPEAAKQRQEERERRVREDAHAFEEARARASEEQARRAQEAYERRVQQSVVDERIKEEQATKQYEIDMLNSEYRRKIEEEERKSAERAEEKNKIQREEEARREREEDEARRRIFIEYAPTKEKVGSKTDAVLLESGFRQEAVDRLKAFMRAYDAKRTPTSDESRIADAYRSVEKQVEHTLHMDNMREGGIGELMRQARERAMELRRVLSDSSSLEAYKLSQRILYGSKNESETAPVSGVTEQVKEMMPKAPQKPWDWKTAINEQGGINAESAWLSEGMSRLFMRTGMPEDAARAFTKWLDKIDHGQAPGGGVDSMPIIDAFGDLRMELRSVNMMDASGSFSGQDLFKDFVDDPDTDWSFYPGQAKLNFANAEKAATKLAAIYEALPAGLKKQMLKS